MSHIGKRNEINPADMERLHRLMLTAVKGEPVSLVAQAALDICLGLWVNSGDVTKDMALHVVQSQIESLFTERSN